MTSGLANRFSGTSGAQGIDQTRAARMANVAEEMLRRQMAAQRLYEPLEDQKDFHRSLATERLVRGGSRAGKSLAGYMEDARAAMGTDPYGKYPTDRPLLIWIICYDESQIGRTAHRLLFRPGAFKIIKDEDTGEWRGYRPWEIADRRRRKEARPAPPLIPRRFAPMSAFAWKHKGRRIFDLCRLQYPKGHPMDGTEIHAFTSGAEAPQGDPVDLVHIDEDLKYFRHVAELQARLSDTAGRLIWTAKPHMDNDALTRMSGRAQEQRDLKHPSVAEFQLVFSQNPHIPAHVKKERIQGWTEKERQVHDLGEFLFDRVRMYPSFDVDVHGLPSELEPCPLDKVVGKGQVPEGSTRYMIVDPGHSFCAVLFAFVPPPHYGDYVVAYDELYLQQCDPGDFADAAEKKVSGHDFYAFIIDDHGSRCNVGTGFNIRQLYSQELKKRRIRSRITGHGFIRGSDDTSGRAMEVRRWLSRRLDGTTRFRMFPEALPNMRHEFANYMKRLSGDETQDKPLPTNSHLMHCLEYLAAYNPRYYRPEHPTGVHSRAYEEFQRWRAEAGQPTGEQRFLHGAQTPIYLGPGKGIL